MEDVAAALSVEYEKVKENLKGVDDHIFKLYGGRDPYDKRLQRRISRPGANVGARGGFGGPSVGRLFGEARRIINNPNREPIGGPVRPERGRGPVRRVSLGDRLGGIQSRLGPKRGRPDSGDEEDVSSRKMTVSSAVVITPVDAPKREDSVAMKTDKKVMARNRRMFGALLGTLQSFQKDSKKEEDKEKRRAEVERKLEEKQKHEQFQLRRDKAALWNERREKQRELRQLEAKMKLVRAFDEWEKLVRDQAYFIKTTKGKHHIFYKPKTMLPANMKALEDTEDYVDDMVEKKKMRLQEEIDIIMSAPIREKQRRSHDQHAEGKEGSNKSDSESGSEHSDDSELEDGEVPSHKQARTLAHESEGSRPVKVEKEEVVEVKREMDTGVAEGSEGQNAEQVGNGVGDEVHEESDDDMDASFNSRASKRSSDQADKVSDSELAVRASESSPAPRRKKKQSPRRSRSVSSSSRSRSRSGERAPRSKPGKKAESTQSSSSGSDSSGSASASDSDSEP